MDPVSIVVAALVVGAAAGLQATAGQVVKDAYAGLKALILRRYGDVGIDGLERRPESDAKQKSVAEDLAERGAADDDELLERAKALLDEASKHEPAAAAAVGVDLEEVEAAYLKIQEVWAAGTGVRLRKGKFSEGIEIGKVDAGKGGESPN